MAGGFCWKWQGVGVNRGVNQSDRHNRPRIDGPSMCCAVLELSMGAAPGSENHIHCCRGRRDLGRRQNAGQSVLVATALLRAKRRSGWLPKHLGQGVARSGTLRRAPRRPHRATADAPAAKKSGPFSNFFLRL